MAHDWIKSALGHGQTMCSRCYITNREAAALGRLNDCQMAPPVADPTLPETPPDDVIEAMARTMVSEDVRKAGGEDFVWRMHVGKARAAYAAARAAMMEGADADGAGAEDARCVAGS